MRLLIDHGAKPLGREFPETSVGWYRREFVLPESDAGRRICVEFDGIFRNATVFFNGHYITENMSGYAPLSVDLTDFVNFADKAAWTGRRRMRHGQRRRAMPLRRARIRARMQTPGSNVLVVRVDCDAGRGVVLRGRGNLSPCVADQDRARAHRALGHAMCAANLGKAPDWLQVRRRPQYL